MSIKKEDEYIEEDLYDAVARYRKDHPADPFLQKAEIIIKDCKNCPFYSVSDGYNACYFQTNTFFFISDLMAECPLNKGDLVFKLCSD